MADLAMSLALPSSVENESIKQQRSGKQQQGPDKQGVGNDRKSSTEETSTVLFDLSSSTSTGEFPSDITFR